MESEKAQEEPDIRGEPGIRGRRWYPTDKQRATAKMLFGLGATMGQVAQYLGVGKGSVQRHLEEEFRWGYELANLRLYGALWDKAVNKKDTACLIFLAKNRLGMMDRPSLFGGVPVGQDPPAREELCIEVRYRYSTEPGALAPPPPERLALAAPASGK